MERAISYLDESNMAIGQQGENGHFEYKDEDVGDALVGFDFKCMRGFDTGRIGSFVEQIMAENNIGLILRHLAFVRDIDEGKGEREVYYHYIYRVFCVYPEEVLRAIPVIIRHFGSWRDIKGLLRIAMVMDDYQFQQVILNMIKTQAEEDMEIATTFVPDEGDEGRRPISLLGKYLPGEKTSGRYNAKLIAKFIFKGSNKMRSYRKMKSTLTRYINLLERNLCANTREQIECDKIPAGAMKKYRVSLTNRTKNGGVKSTDQGRVEFASRLQEFLGERVRTGQGVSSKGIEIRSIVEEILNGQYNETLVRAFLQDLEGKIGDLSRIIPIVDTSGSMCGVNGEIYAAIGLGVLISMKTMVPFRNRMITFSNEPSWFAFRDTDTFEERVTKARSAPWGMNTNYYATARLIVGALREAQVPAEEVRDLTLVVFSDMQFDQSTTSKGKTVMSKMRKIFGDAGYDVPTLVFWNLRGNTTGSPVTCDENNVVQVSGFNQNMMNSFLSDPKDMNPKSMLRKVLLGSRYDVMDSVL
jgi:hypothetical protein